MERVFVDILNEVCPKPENRNWEKFFEISEKYYVENRDITFLKSVVAIQNRIRRYSLGTLKDIFVKRSGLNVKEIFTVLETIEMGVFHEKSDVDTLEERDRALSVMVRVVQVDLVFLLQFSLSFLKMLDQTRLRLL